MFLIIDNSSRGMIVSNKFHIKCLNREDNFGSIILNNFITMKYLVGNWMK